MGDTFEGDNSGYIDSGFSDTGATYADVGGGDSFAIDYATYDSSAPESQLNEPNYAQYPDYPSSASDANSLFQDYLDYYVELGYDPLTAASLAAEDAGGPAFQLEGSAPAPLPDIYTPPPFPYQTPYVPLDVGWPTLPNDLTVPPAPPLPQSPATQQPNLPPACPGGQYHPYPIGDPRQNLCIPFPAAETQHQAPRPTSSTSPAPSGSSGSTSAPKPATPTQPKPTAPTSTQCPTGYYKAASGCVPIPKCTTPGTVFDTRTGRCVPYAQAQAPGCPIGYWINPATRQCEIAPLCQSPLVFDPNTGLCVQASQLAQEDIFGSLKNLPWWLWAGLAALLLLSRDSEGRTTTVRYRRAT